MKTIQTHDHYDTESQEMSTKTVDSFVTLKCKHDRVM